MEKEIREHGTNDRPLRRSFLAANQRPIRHQDGRFQPPLHVQQHPRTIGVSPYGPHQKFMIDFIKGTYDILPIISTFQKRSPLSDLGTRSKANCSTFSGRCIRKVGSFSF
jgi:hypothetical protein